MAFCGFLELSNFLFNHSGNTVHLRMGQGGWGLNRYFGSCNAECKILQSGLENRTCSVFGWSMAFRLSLRPFKIWTSVSLGRFKPNKMAAVLNKMVTILFFAIRKPNCQNVLISNGVWFSEFGFRNSTVLTTSSFSVRVSVWMWMSMAATFNSWLSVRDQMKESVTQETSRSKTKKFQDLPEIVALKNNSESFVEIKGYAISQIRLPQLSWSPYSPICCTSTNAVGTRNRY